MFGMADEKKSAGEGEDGDEEEEDEVDDTVAETAGTPTP